MVTLKSKLLTILLFIFAVLIANSVIAVINFSNLKNSIDNILKANYESVIFAQNMAIAIERQDSAELALMFEENKENPKRLFKDNEADFLELLSKAEANITEKGEDQIISNINVLYDEYLIEFDRLGSLIDSEVSNDQEIRDYYYNEIFPLFEKIKDECRNLLNINQDKMVVLKNESSIIADRATYITIIISVVTIIISLILIIYLINKIINSLKNFNSKIKNIAEGNYSQKLDVSGKDELASLAKEFNIMAEKLQTYDRLNVDQLMKEKQKIETIVESISDGIIVTGAVDRILLLNKAAEKIFNVDEKRAIKKNFLEVIKNNKLYEFIKSKKVEDSETSSSDYLDISKKDKAKINHYRVIVKAITNLEGESIGVVTLLQDITKLKELDELKSEFVASVSHELRTPIASVLMAAELLQNDIPGKTSEKQKEMIKIIIEDGNRLKNLINDILDLSRLESGKVKLNIKKYKLEEIINYVLKILDIRIKEENISVKTRLKKSLPPVKVDFSKISQVLTNLISNSINYKKENKKLSIEIGARLYKNKVLVYVSDNGRGIIEKDQKKIFERFTETESYDEIKPRGSGLGLSISKSIIKSHGGDIWVESNVGKGSTFYFTLAYSEDALKV